MIANKKALSEVVSTVLIIGVTVLVGAVVWVVVSGIVGEQLDEGEACFGVLDQVQINRDYTCYNPTTNKMQFSLSVGDLDVDAILVSVSYEGTSKSATLNGTLQIIPYVTNYVETGVGVCGGSAIACDGLSQIACGEQAGCFWNPGGNICTGTPTACSSLATQSSCLDQSGCVWSTGVKMPSKNGGSTYFFNEITSMPVSISMIPIINGKQCGATDVLREIIDCNALIS